MPWISKTRLLELEARLEQLEEEIVDHANMAFHAERSAAWERRRAAKLGDKIHRQRLAIEKLKETLSLHGVGVTRVLGKGGSSAITGTQLAKESGVSVSVRAQPTGGTGGR